VKNIQGTERAADRYLEEQERRKEREEKRRERRGPLAACAGGPWPA
jgi:hypothetical protein